MFRFFDKLEDHIRAAFRNVRHRVTHILHIRMNRFLIPLLQPRGGGGQLFSRYLRHE